MNVMQRLILEHQQDCLDLTQPQKEPHKNQDNANHMILDLGLGMLLQLQVLKT